MGGYEWCLKAWVKGWATQEDLQVWVKANKITQEEYDVIISTPKS